MADLHSGKDSNPAGNSSPGPNLRHRYILRVILGYAIFGALWIYLSDIMLSALVDVTAIYWLSTAKGLLFIMVTTLLLAVALRGVPGEAPSQPGVPRLELLLAASPGRRVWLYGFAVAITVAMLLVRSGIAVSFGERPLLILFMFPVILSAMVGGLGPGLVATLLVALGAAHCLPPADSFLISQPHDLFSWSFLAASGVLISILAEMLHRFRRQSEANLQLQAVTLASIGDGVITTDTQGRITFLNPEAVRLTGWTRDEAMGRSVIEVFRVVNDQSRQSLADPVEKVLASGEAVGLVDHALLLTRDGREVPVQDSGAPIRLVNGVMLGVVLVFRDVGARLMAENALRDSEAKLRTLGDNLPEGYMCQYTRGKDGIPRFLYVSAGVRRINDVSPEEVVRDANVLRRQIDPAQVRAFIEAERQSAADLGDFVMDLHMRRPDGDWRWLHLSARPHARPDGQLVWDGVAIDITARREAEAQLSKLSAAVEQTPAVVVITDPSARIEYVNPAFTRVTGYTLEEVLGKNPSLLKSGETPAEVYQDLWQTISSGREWRGVLHNRRKDGTLFWERVVISAVRDATGKTTSYVAVKEDITEQKGLESIGRLAGGVAHDFNNMLMVISGYADLTLMQTESDDPRYQGLQEIKSAARRSADLTRQLLAFARKQTVAPVVLDMNETIEGMLKMLRRLIGEDIELAWLPGSGLWKVKIDPSQIDQLLANLAVNARDAIAGVGTVTIKTENVALDASYCARHQGCSLGDHVLLMVSDTGLGMSHEVVAHIFEPFFTTKEEGKGTGLGLATVYGIVKQNLGFISVESEPGQGTTFRVHLPRVVDKAKSGSPAAESMEEILPGGTETVLLVEDEKALLDLGRQFIESLGYRVLTANSPAEAMRQAEGYEGVIHLLVTDVVMPQMNGKELSERLRQRFPGLKCIFMSGYSADIIAKQGMLEAGIHFLQKPFALRDVAFKARKALEE